MQHKKKILTLLALVVFVLLGMAAMKQPVQKERNLKILPKDISDQKLDSIMHTYNKALGVTCNFCHVKVKALFPVPASTDTLDYASDAEPMKENARKMMQMTIYINKTLFYFDSTMRPEYLNTVTCKTCHRGEPIPPDN